MLGARIRRSLAISKAVWLVFCTGCGGATQEPVATAPRRVLNQRKPAESAQQPTNVVWELFERVQSWPAENERAFRSSGHFGGRYTTRLHVNPESRNAYATLVADSKLAPNTVIASLLYEPDDDKLVVIYAMRKLDDLNWEYSVVSADGRLTAQGALTRCVRCHSEAVGDSLFGLPHLEP